MRQATIAAALALALSAPAAHAGPSGNTALDHCTGDLAGRAWCLGYVAGVVNASPLICPPPGTTSAQSRDIVVKALQEVPAVRHMPAHVLIEAALGAAGWECKPQQGQPQAPGRSM